MNILTSVQHLTVVGLLVAAVGLLVAVVGLLVTGAPVGLLVTGAAVGFVVPDNDFDFAGFAGFEGLGRLETAGFLPAAT